MTAIATFLLLGLGGVVSALEAAISDDRRRRGVCTWSRQSSTRPN